MGAMRRSDSGSNVELPVIPQGSSGQGGTVYVDFYSTKPIYPVTKCHLNAMVADTKKWEQSTAFALDVQSDHVKRWVKNDHVGFYIPYRKRNIPARYIPDFIAVLDNGLQLIIETKGQYGDDADLKAKAAQRWVDAVNRLGEHGRWDYKVVDGPQKVIPLIERLAAEPLNEAPRAEKQLGC
jgi:type III restriction enzyme